MDYAPKKVKVDYNSRKSGTPRGERQTRRKLEHYYKKDRVEQRR